jgi:hypothetical protein
MRLRFFSSLIATSLILGGCATSLYAQSRTETGGITGSVVDRDGRAILAATIVVRDESNGHTQALATDSAGRFALPGLPTGSYTVEATAPGMALGRQTDVKVTAGQHADLAFKLSVGNVQENVTIKGAGALAGPEDFFLRRFAFDVRRAYEAHLPPVWRHGWIEAALANGLTVIAATVHAPEGLCTCRWIETIKNDSQSIWCKRRIEFANRMVGGEFDEVASITVHDCNARATGIRFVSIKFKDDLLTIGGPVGSDGVIAYKCDLA